ncbi:MAG: glucose-1-phosphate adenylyltransferase [Chloroflexi bacterium HGW-Chloroflexi-6]|jgi:glucose-1-phosphate adenylyltransferase|nr:MAG: glucose-1-phosphate adenylyltransferase [Chloroflexi bacterium HGW-Chloroflexi-6]
MPALDEILSIILGGGRGARLYPLTKLRSKPAVPIAGKYRLIDIPISNCINSHIYRIAVLTQFHSVSLHRHITNTYQFDHYHAGWVQILAAEQTLTSDDWYQGTADAVRKQIREIQASGAKYVLILAGDHLYRMDYSKMAAFHWEKEADITVAVQPVSREEASRLGILKRGDDDRITAFVEKPKDPKVQAQFVSREDDPERPFLASMGIYMFKTEVLIDLLTNFPDHDDFGKDVIPHALGKQAVFGYGFEGYWMDIGTIRAFYETNLELATANPPFNFFDPDRPIYTNPRILPGSQVMDSNLKDVLLSEGCRIQKAKISHSLIGLRSHIGPGTVIKDTIMMGADDYDMMPHRKNDVAMGVGPNCHIEGAILDKNVRIGEGVVIKPFPRGTEIDAGTWVVQDGIVVIPKDTTILPNTRIAPE